jgi:hypothetical protein
VTDDIDAIGPAPTQEQADALLRLMTAATDLVNHRLSGELAGTDFHDALARRAASIELVITLPAGDLQATARYPAMGPRPLPLFEVKGPRRT